MADSVSVKITGPDLGMRVSLLNAQIQELAEEELDRVADQVQSDAKDGCPVAQNPKKGEIPGTLRDDIKVYASKLKRQIGNLNVYYSVFVHQGTYKMKARPYLLNAAETNNPVFIQNMRNIKLSVAW